MSDHVLVINAGSSSLKYSVVDARTGEAAAAGLVERIGESQSRQVHRSPAGETESTRSITRMRCAERSMPSIPTGRRSRTWASRQSATESCTAAPGSPRRR